MRGRRIVGRIEHWIDGADSAGRAEPVATPVAEPVGEPVATPVAEPVASLAAKAERRPADRERIARRGFFGAVGAAVAGVVLLTGGQSIAILRPLNVFAPRERGFGPNSLPVNRSAKAAGVLETAVAPDWSLMISGNGIHKRYSRSELRDLGLVQVDLPISCVEGWSQMATWRGIPMRQLIALVGAKPDSKVRVTSLEKTGSYRIMEMGPEYTQDPTTLVALELNGADLDIEHGYPARIIAPGRPGVLQTKWLSAIEVVA